MPLQRPGRPAKLPEDRTRTPVRGMRIPDDEWDAIKRKAEASGKSATQCVREIMKRWAQR